MNGETNSLAVVMNGETNSQAVAREHQKILLKFFNDLENYNDHFLTIYDIDINDAFMKSGRNLELNKFIHIITIARCQFTDDVACQLPNYLSQNRKIKMIVLQGNEIGDKTAVNFGKLLESKNTNIQRLDLSINQITKSGSEAIGRALMINNSLKQLFLGNNQFQLDENSSIIKALQFNKTLERLGLSWIPVTSSGANRLIKALKTNYTLTHLNFVYDIFNPKQDQAIDSLLKRNRNFPRRKKEFITCFHYLKNLLPLELVIMIYNHLIEVHLYL